jgi:hypothetical protein
LGVLVIGTETAYDLLYSALRRVGVVALGDTVDPAVAQEALLELNAIRAEWSLNNKNYNIYDQTFTAIAPMMSVTLGTAIAGPGNFPSRPTNVDQITVISGTPGLGINYPVQILPYEAYQREAIQNIVSIPDKAYINTGFPLMTIYFLPGLAQGWSVRVMGSAYMTEYETVSDQFMDPPEYWSPLDLVLTLRLAVKWGVDLPQGVVIQANSALKHIQAANFVSNMEQMENGLISGHSGFNFFAGM